MVFISSIEQKILLDLYIGSNSVKKKDRNYYYKGIVKLLEYELIVLISNGKNKKYGLTPRGIALSSILYDIYKGKIHPYPKIEISWI